MIKLVYLWPQNIQNCHSVGRYRRYDCIWYNIIFLKIGILVFLTMNSYLKMPPHLSCENLFSHLVKSGALNEISENDGRCYTIYFPHSHLTGS